MHTASCTQTTAHVSVELAAQLFCVLNIPPQGYITKKTFKINRIKTMALLNVKKRMENNVISEKFIDGRFAGNSRKKLKWQLGRFRFLTEKSSPSIKNFYFVLKINFILIKYQKKKKDFK